MPLSDDMTIAKARIAEEKRKQTGFLDLSGLQIEMLPQELSQLTSLRQLKCRGRGLPSPLRDLSSLSGLTDLQNLDCGGTHVRDLSPLSGLIALQQLDCSYSMVSDLSPLSRLTALGQLICWTTRVKDLSPLSGLIALQQLNLRDTLISDLSPLSNLTALQWLDCSVNPVNDLSPLSGLTNLQQLHCSLTLVDDLLPLSGLTALLHLDCGQTKVSDLSPLSNLAALQVLVFNLTQVSDLSPLSGLTALQQIDCMGTRISDLSPLSDLKALKQLRCAFTQVSDLSSLPRLTALQRLDCGGSQVRDLSPVSGLTALQHFNCGDTQVCDLSPLSSLTALQILYCHRTKVRDLSPLSELTALRFLNCSECSLAGLPPLILSIESLELVAFKTHIPSIPPEILSQVSNENCVDKLRAHFADLAQEAADLPDIKLLLLGNGGVGKTQIARWLSGSAFDTAWDSTHGIQIFGRRPDDSIAARLNLQIWDFGGQDIYHGTHAMFLRGPAILMPVWAADRENREEYEYEGLTFRNHPLAYWLDIVRHQASNENPVLIVQNKCDTIAHETHRFPIPEETLQALPYSKEHHFSAKTHRGEAALRESLQDAITWLRDPERLGLPKIGAGRLRVQRRLEAMRDADWALSPNRRQYRLLDYEGYETICAQEGGVSSPALLLDYLNATGTVFYRAGMFANRIVLDQSWAFEAIYIIFDRKRVYKILQQDHGRFTRDKLALLVWQNHSEDDQKLLLSMMVSCGICFFHRRFSHNVDDENSEYIAPDLLPPRTAVAETLNARWSETAPTETATFHYPLLHSGLIRSIMSEIGQLAGIDALYWRGGLLTYEAKTQSRLLIEEQITDEGWQGTIQVRTQNGQAAMLLQQIIELIERIQSQLSLHHAKIDRTSPHIELPNPTEPIYAQEKPRKPEWYVSYAWGDATPEGRAREEIVDRLCASAKANGHEIIRDKNTLGLGDSISKFMKRIGAADRIFVILSDKYLRSPFCMFELSEVWRTSRQEDETFLRRVRVFRLPDAKVSDPTDWIDWAAHWKQQHDNLDAKARQHGVALLGEPGFRRLTQMQNFYTQVSNILGALADIVTPRTFEQLEQYGFNDLPNDSSNQIG